MNGNPDYPLLSRHLGRWPLASNSWSVWMETFWERRVLGVILLPIREAYEWKLTYWILLILLLETCFQFVKRMNGNFPALAMMTVMNQSCFQFVKRMNGNIVTASLWLQFPLGSTCFQFVKRMNGNKVNSWCSVKSWVISCFQFVKRMNGNELFRVIVAGNVRLASNSWSVWMEIMCRVNSWIDPTIFLIPIS